MLTDKLYYTMILLKESNTIMDYTPTLAQCKYQAKQKAWHYFMEWTQGYNELDLNRFSITAEEV